MGIEIKHLEKLTERKKSVILLLQHGKSIREIGEIFNLSEARVVGLAIEAIKVISQSQGGGEDTSADNFTGKELISNEEKSIQSESEDYLIYRQKLSILNYLDLNPGTTSEVIAEGLGLDKFRVENLLHITLNYECMQDDYGRWYLRMIKDHWWFPYSA